MTAELESFAIQELVMQVTAALASVAIHALASVAIQMTAALASVGIQMTAALASVAIQKLLHHSCEHPYERLDDILVKKIALVE